MTTPNFQRSKPYPTGLSQDLMELLQESLTKGILWVYAQE